MIAILVYRAGSYLGRVLPWKVAAAITWTIGQLSCLFMQRTRRVVEANLDIVYGGSLSKKELRKKSRRIIMNFSRTIMVFLELPNLTWEGLRENVDMSEFDAAMAELGGQRSFLLASPHVGPYELGGLCLSGLGFKPHTAALDHPNEKVTRFFDERRRGVGVTSYPMRKSYTALKRALAGGDVVAILVDRAYGATARRFDYFGTRPLFPLGHLYLSASTGVPIVTVAFVFDGKDRYKWVHGGIHYPPSEGTEDLDKLEAMQRAILGDFEMFLRDYSDQWFQFLPLLEADGENNGD